ncbi:MAG: IS3 family transposase, partial [Myxococcales bacterium]|nr:IS3 family transposase [Myxococcales bacterium]
FVTPNERHCGESEELLAKRRCVYEEAKKRNPRRWSGGTRTWKSPCEVFLNPDKETMERLRN